MGDVLVIREHDGARLRLVDHECVTCSERLQVELTLRTQLAQADCRQQVESVCMEDNLCTYHRMERKLAQAEERAEKAERERGEWIRRAEEELNDGADMEEERDALRAKVERLKAENAAMQNINQDALRRACDAEVDNERLREALDYVVRTGEAARCSGRTLASVARRALSAQASARSFEIGLCARNGCDRNTVHDMEFCSDACEEANDDE